MIKDRWVIVLKGKRARLWHKFTEVQAGYSKKYKTTTEAVRALFDMFCDEFFKE